MTTYEMVKVIGINVHTDTEEVIAVIEWPQLTYEDIRDVGTGQPVARLGSDGFWHDLKTQSTYSDIIFGKDE